MLAFAIAVPFYTGAAAENEETYSGYESDYAILTALGFISASDNFSKTGYMTRGEAAKYIVRASGAQASEKSTQMFSDVASSNENYEYINTAASRKYINGIGENQYKPNDKIKPLDFAIGLMNVLGYGEIGELAGYSDGWQGLANRLGLLDGIALADELTGEYAVKMLKTALECEPVELVAIGETNYYKSEPGVTLLEKAHDIIKARGIVDRDTYTSTYTQDGAGAGMCGIDGLTFLSGNVDATALLGRCVDYYYKETDESAYKQLLYASGYRNTEAVLNYDEIGAVSVTSITMESDNGKSKTYRISKSASFIYNYKQQAIDEELMKPKYGDVTLVDNDRDAVYDVVIVREYKQLLVDYVSGKSGNIVGSDGVVLVLDPDIECDYIAYSDNVKTSASAISAGMTLNYIISDGAGRNVIEMRISRESMEAAAETIDDDEIVIDKESYKISPYFDFTGINIGTYYTWYIDCNDVVSFAEPDKPYVYGYLNWLYQDEFDQKIHMKIFTENARWVELELRDKLKFNGESGRTAESVYSVFGTEASGYRQMITYKVNADAQIVELNTAKVYDAWSAAERDAINNGTFRARKFSSQLYRTAISAFGTGAYLTGKKTIFFIPKQEGNSTSENDFYIGNTSNLTADASYSGYVYDCDKTGGAQVCMLSTDYLTNKVDAISSVMIVKKVIKTVNSDNELIYNIKGMYKGYEVEINTAASGNFGGVANLEFGDIIQFTTNPNGEMSAYVQKFDYSSQYGKNAFFNGAAYHNATLGGGTLYEIDTGNNMMVFSTASKVMFTFLDGCTYYLVDTGERTMKITDLSDVAFGRYMVVRGSYFRAQEVVIYI